MVTLFPDTSPYIERLLLEHLRQMPTWRKLALVGGMNRAGRDLAMAGLRQRYPNDTPARHRRLATLLPREELAARVYGPAPEET